VGVAHLPGRDAPELGALWREMTDRLRGSLSAGAFNLSFDRAHPVALHEDRLVIGLETALKREWVQHRHRALLRDVLFEVLGADLEVELVVAPSTGDDRADPELPDPRPAAAIPSQARGLQPRFTFEAFVTGPTNRFAAAAALSVAEQPARAYNPLFIYGGVGLGKTHLLHAIGHFVAHNHPELSVCYVSSETFTNEFIDALRDKSTRSFKDRYRTKVDILLVDDIQSLAGKEQTQEEFFHTFNALHDAGKQIVLSSDRPPKEIATLEDRLRSRFEMGLMTDVQPPDLETRIAILRKRVQEGGFELRDPEVLGYIADRVSANVRSLEGALTRVVAHGSIEGRPLTVELASEALRDVFPAAEGGVGIDAIAEEVCRYFGVTRQELSSDRRTRRIVGPRQVAMYLSREMTDASLPFIGRAFGNRDHSTVMYAVQKVASLMASGQGETYAAVRVLTARLNGGRAAQAP
jgi:chromosomal replication initiator protein